MSDTSLPQNNANATTPIPKNLPELQAIVATAAENDARIADPLNSGIPQQTAVGVVDDVLEVQIGGTGTILIAGFLANADYNREMQGTQRIITFDKMRKGDATVRSALAAVKYPIFSTNWYIKPPEDEDANGQRTIFAKQELFENPNFSWNTFMNQAFLFCDYGSSFHEKVWRRRADNKIGLKKFAPRLPQTISRYTMDDGITPGITQILPTGGNAQIPQWKLLMFIHELEGSNYEGTSLLRPMHKHWFYKDLYYKIDSIAAERQGMGVPIITVPPQATDADKKQARIVAANMRVNQNAYIDLPQGFKLEYIDTKAKGLKDVETMVTHHDRQILKAVNAQFLDSGGSRGVGSQALAQAQMEAFIMMEEYIAKTFQEPTQLALNELMDMNFTGLKPNQYPQIEHGNIGNVDLTSLSGAIKNFVDSGVLLPDDNLEQHIRQLSNLPEAQKDTSARGTDWKERKMQQVPQLPGGQKQLPAKAGGKSFSENDDMLIFNKHDLYELHAELEEVINLHHANKR